jgi:hypothetical protein
MGMGLMQHMAYLAEKLKSPSPRMSTREPVRTASMLSGSLSTLSTSSSERGGVEGVVVVVVVVVVVGVPASGTCAGVCECLGTLPPVYAYT